MYNYKELKSKEIVTNNQILCQTNNLFGLFGKSTHFQTLNLDDKNFLNSIGLNESSSTDNFRVIRQMKDNF